LHTQYAVFSPTLIAHYDRNNVQHRYIYRINRIERIVNYIIKNLSTCVQKHQKVVLVPSMYPITYLAKNTEFLPISIFLFLKRKGPSNPYDLELFLDDVETSLKNFRNIDNIMIVFLYDYWFSNILIKYLPIVLTLKIDVDRLKEVYSIASIDIDCPWLKIDDNAFLQIGIYGTKTREKIEQNPMLRDIINSRGYKTIHGCDALMCLNHIDELNKNAKDIYSFKSIKALNEFFLGVEDTSSKILAFEIYSSLIHRLLERYESISYLWIPHPFNSMLREVYEVLESKNISIEKGIIILSKKYLEVFNMDPVSLSRCIDMLRIFAKRIEVYDPISREVKYIL